MIKNYFIIALRNIRRYPAHAILNISGMAIGMTCAILLLLYVQDELSFDKFHKNADNLYRVIQKDYFDWGVFQGTQQPDKLAAVLKEEYPEIIRSSRFSSFQLTFRKGDEFINEWPSFVDKDFLEMYNIEFIRGDKNSALTKPNDFIITDEIAHKYFGNEDPLGKTFTSKDHVFTVTGVVKRLPKNSSIQFDFLIPYELKAEFGVTINDWLLADSYTYIELQKGTDSKIVDSKIKDIYKRKVKKDVKSEIYLQNIKKIRLYSYPSGIRDIQLQYNIVHIRLAILVSIMILVIACINFMNLSTAQSARRAKEIGMRKVAGANKRKIIIQFLGESLLIVFVAHVIAMILVELLLPSFSNYLYKELKVNYQSVGLYISLISLILFCGLLAGSYPAFYLSSLKPLNILKGINDKNTGSASFRKVLVIFQFTLSIIFILCTLIVRNQLNYLQNENPGFNRDNIGYFTFKEDMHQDVLKKDLSNNPNILSVSITGQNALYGAFNMGSWNWKGKEKEKGGDVLLLHLNVDEEYAKTFQLKMKEGHFFSAEFSKDTTAVVINEKAAEIMRFKDPVGEILLNPQKGKYHIVGVVKDFNFESLRTVIKPLVIHMQPKGSFCYIKMKSDHIKSKVEYINKTVKSYNLPYPQNFTFLDNEYNWFYDTDRLIAIILGYITFLVNIISCLGLVGLSTFMTLRRTKEIGIRKANGAKTFEIFSQLSKEYIILVSISFIIASPIAWYGMNMWLQSFAYRTNIGWWIFVLTWIIVFVITMLTVGFQSYKAASKNPVEALRYE